ncbi:MAG: type II toxin-antitoxin system VapC family toxin [Gammaproteobacteria bacterium]|nr:type II toxin-antitoxin system VapC family toxin [Gammaproteobacteria bacterium]MCY4199866.1 type II toxin-antitoxin system VapC family toxin [Gammaproteobacteria bacterium]MCY4277703.1 type II toxin-antitoxin system VapC family toxin [Gammaproteobacteria bacterium]MCY4322908.1 type II toxin-antitoxin system VapC family toxin [Gammaproteobacteria bacterium]
MYIIDTDILSALREKRRDARIERWIESRRPSDLFLSVVTVAEMECQIARENDSDPKAGRELGAWIDRLLDLYQNRIIGVDLAIAKRWGRLSTEVGHEGADLLIAATALERGLTVVTLNVSRFRPTGVQTLDPSAVRVAM